MCPVHDQWLIYLEGGLDAPSESALDLHLETCVTCRSTVETLDRQANGSLAWLGSNAPVAPTADDGDLARWVAEAKAIVQGALPAAARLPMTGDVLGNYLLLEPIGAGGMGRVFKALHQRLKREVAIKLLVPELLRLPSARGRFQQEMEVVAKLASPHIAAAYDAGECQGHDFLVMEYVPGKNLAEIVKSEGPLEPARALNYIRQAALGLGDAHAAGIVHRDVKPANLLLTNEGIVKVLDLGLASLPLTRAAAPETNGTATVMGTAAFMAPEQALVPDRADARADIYSLGCTLYYLLTGRAPFAGATSRDIIRAHAEGALPAVRDLRPDCPRAVEELVGKMLAKDPADRPPTMRDMCRAIDALRAERSRSKSARRIWIAALAGSAAALGLVAYLAIEPPWAVKDNGNKIATPSPVKAIISDKKVQSPAVDLVAIPAGEFWMGSPDNDNMAFPDERPRRQIKITLPFLLGKTKVTQSLYEEVMGTNPSAFSPQGRYKELVRGMDTSRNPVDSLRWLDAIAFCNTLSVRHELPAYYQVDGESVVIQGGTGYRLPTEAEWEYACRGGKNTIWCFGDDPAELDNYAWFGLNSRDCTHPVGEKRANPFGLFDVLGNVPEWCWDRYDATYYHRMPLSDPPGSPLGETRVHRGGAWNSAIGQVRPACRDSRNGAYAVLALVGMRVARNAP